MPATVTAGPVVVAAAEMFTPGLLLQHVDIAAVANAIDAVADVEPAALPRLRFKTGEYVH